MLFESEAKPRFIHAISPSLAKDFEKKTAKGKKLPKKKVKNPHKPKGKTK